MKRIVTIQDISCVGKCSLTVALPIISAMGIETAVIPTAVLSTHTAFKNFTYRDLTGYLPKIAKHWKQEKFTYFHSSNFYEKSYHTDNPLLYIFQLAPFYNFLIVLNIYI